MHSYSSYSRKKISSPNRLKKISALNDFKNNWNNFRLIVSIYFSSIEDRDIVELKKKIYGYDVKYKVYKNNLVKKFIIEEIDKKNIVSPNIFKEGAFIFCNDFSCLRVFNDFSKKNNNVGEFKWGFYNDKFLSSQEVAQISLLPSKSDLIKDLIFNLNWPIVNLITTLEKIKKT